MADILIDATTIITMDPQRRIISDGAVAIEGDHIVDVGPSSQLRSKHRAKMIIEGRNTIVIPGLVDLYAHSGGAMLKSLGEGIDGAAWRNMLDDVAFRHATSRWWYVESQLHAIERLRNGCTMMLSQPGVSHARMDNLLYARQTQKAFEDLGIRARVIAGIARAPWPQTYRDYIDGRWVARQVDIDECFSNIEQLIREAKQRPSPLVDYCTGASRIGNPNPVDPMYTPEQAKYVEQQSHRLREIMDRYDVGYWVHAYGNAIEYAYDHDLGLLTSKSILSHCTGISRRSIGILADTQTRVNHCPRARRIISYRQDCPLVELLEAGVTVGLGGDAPYIDRSGDPFLDMQEVIRLQRHRFGDATVIPPGKALEMATIDAHRALHLDDVLGSVEAGKKADLVLVNAYTARLWPLTMPVHQLVYFGSGADVKHVIVNGQQVVRDGRVTLVDEAALLAEAAEEMARLMSIKELGLRELAALSPRTWGHARPSDGPIVPAPRWTMPDHF